MFIHTFITDVNGTSEGLRDTTANTLHTRLNKFLSLSRKRSSGSYYFHIICNDSRPISTINSTTRNNTGLQLFQTLLQQTQDQ